MSAGDEPSRERLLGLEIRSQEIGFVVFDGATRIMDWGTRMAIDLQDRRRVVALNAICRVLDFYHPSVITVHRDGASASAVHVAAIIRAEARRRAAQCHIMPTAEIARFYAALGCTKKRAIALLIAEWFGDLAWELPPKRKAWQSQSRHVLIFDAAAVGIVFLATRATAAA